MPFGRNAYAFLTFPPFRGKVRRQEKADIEGVQAALHDKNHDGDQKAVQTKAFAQGDKDDRFAEGFGIFRSRADCRRSTGRHRDTAANAGQPDRQRRADVAKPLELSAAVCSDWEAVSSRRWFPGGRRSHRKDAGQRHDRCDRQKMDSQRFFSRSAPLDKNNRDYYGENQKSGGNQQIEKIHNSYLLKFIRPRFAVWD